MGFLEAMFLGLVQGLTEFLPVSSSGHLVMARSLMGDVPEGNVLFEAILHCGTLFAVLCVFRTEIRGMLSCLRPGGEPSYRRLLFWILLATLPTGLIGLFGKKLFYELFQSPRFAASMLYVTGALLWLSERMTREGVAMADMGPGRSLGVGIMQGIAITPGISRSGSTIAAGRLLGLRPEEAARFSFLISLPAVAGATLLEARHAETVPGAQLGIYLLGAAVAFVSGLWSIRFLLRIVKGARLSWFAYYCWAAATAFLILT